MDLFRTRRLVGGNDYPYIDLLSFLVGDDLRDNRLLFLDKETIQEINSEYNKLCAVYKI